MTYTKKFQQLADAAIERVAVVMPEDLDAILAAGGVALDIRDKEEHDADHMNIEEMIPKIDTIIVCYCNANNRGALSADTLQSMGYTNAKYIKGGLKAFRALKTH